MGHAKDFGFHSQCSRQPLKGLNRSSDVIRETFLPSLSGLDLQNGWEESKMSVCREAFEEAVAMQMLSTTYRTWFLIFPMGPIHFQSHCGKWAYPSCIQTSVNSFRAFLFNALPLTCDFPH